jgi:hypothetical protein
MLNKNAVMHGDKYFKSDDLACWTYNDKATSYITHVDNAIRKASSHESKLPDEATIQSILGGTGAVLADGKEIPDLPMEYRLMGFSGVCFRHFLNNLCNFEDANYLEIGTFRGSSLVSAAYGNTDVLNEIHAIDNFSEFIVEDSGFHPRDDIEKNFNLYLGPAKNKINFYEEDCWSFDLTKLPKIQIYFYDGDHSQEAQTKAFTYFEPVFDDVFIAVVDDWNQRKVRLGTEAALSQINYDVIGSRAIIPGRRPDNASRVNNPDPLWWGGTYIAVLRKRGI